MLKILCGTASDSEFSEIVSRTSVNCVAKRLQLRIADDLMLNQTIDHTEDHRSLYAKRAQRDRDRQRREGADELSAIEN